MWQLISGLVHPLSVRVIVKCSLQRTKDNYLFQKDLHTDFPVLSAKAEVLYKCDGFYNKESESGIIYNDPALNIDWQVPAKDAIVSDKDKILPLFKDCKNSFVFES
jgi:dTDP-4-dehydrorhamnose 3,5-epimerase